MTEQDGGVGRNITTARARECRGCETEVAPSALGVREYCDGCAQDRMTGVEWL